MAEASRSSKKGLTIRISSETLARLRELAGRTELKPSHVARKAFAIGLQMIEEDPTRLLRPRD